MKKTLFGIGGLLAIFLVLSSFIPIQTFFGNEPMPTDPQVRSGVLTNGMRYYIRLNKNPEKRGEFYIAHNVGAIQEEDDQNGLAHFTEHMAFNGTKNFPDKNLLNYMATLGVKFGQNVNAYTSQTATVYNLSDVPLLREGIIDSALLILHDWSNHIAFEAAEIDAERGVIMEEWRTYGSADERMNNKLMPIMFKGSKYGKRDVIGDTAVIRNFKHQTIKDFYHRWYRTDLQAVILVGDFDLDQMEAKVIKLFSTIKPVENPEPKVDFDVPDNDEPLIGTASDIEASGTSVSVYFKHNAVKNEDKDLNYMRNRLVQRFASNMLMARFTELSSSANAPFVQAYGYYGGFSGNKDAFALVAMCKDNESLKAMNALLIEAERMKQFGFTASEFERAKANMLRSYDMSFNDRNNRKNRQLVSPILNNFLRNEPNPGIEFEYNFAKKAIAEITLAEVNEAAQKFVTEKNRVVSVTAPEKAGVTLPSEEAIKEVLNNYKNNKIEAYVDKMGNSKLIEKEPIAGKVSKITENKALGTTEWVLSNGVKVVFKPTDFKAEELMMEAYAMGGSSLVADDNLLSAALLSSAFYEMGTANFSRTDLSKLLAGKNASISPAVGADRALLNGNMSVKDFETAMQLVYLAFTNPRWNEVDYNTWNQKIKTMIANQSADPRSAFSDTISLATRNYHKRAKLLNEKTLNEVSMEKMKTVYNRLFTNAAGYTFIFTGTINPTEAKPIIEKYLASLPVSGKAPAFVDTKVRFPQGKLKKDFKIANKTPRTSVFINYNFACKYTAHDRLMMAAIRHMLELRYTEIIREQKGGAYGVRVSANMSVNPVQVCDFIVSFDTDPLKADDLASVVHEQIAKMANEGPLEADLQKAKEYFIKSYSENLKENRWWRGTVSEYYYRNTDVLTNYEAMVNALTLQSVQAYAKKAFAKPNVVEVIMRPLEQ